MIKRLYLALRRAALRILVRPPAIPAGSPGEPWSAVLVISERRLGDVSLEIPAIRSLRSACPNAVLGIVAPKNLHPLLEWACRPDILFDYSNRKEIRSQEWDAAIDLTCDYHLEPALLAAGSRAPLRIGFAYAGRERF